MHQEEWNDGMLSQVKSRFFIGNVIALVIQPSTIPLFHYSLVFRNSPNNHQSTSICETTTL